MAARRIAFTAARFGESGVKSSMQGAMRVAVASASSIIAAALTSSMAANGARSVVPMNWPILTAPYSRVVGVLLSGRLAPPLRLGRLVDRLVLVRGEPGRRGVIDAHDGPGPHVPQAGHQPASAAVSTTANRSANTYQPNTISSRSAIWLCRLRSP